MKEIVDITEGVVRIDSYDEQMSVFKKCIFLQYAGLKMRDNRAGTFVSHVVCIKQSS